MASSFAARVRPCIILIVNSNSWITKHALPKLTQFAARLGGDRRPLDIEEDPVGWDPVVSLRKPGRVCLPNAPLCAGKQKSHEVVAVCEYLATIVHGAENDEETQGL